MSNKEVKELKCPKCGNNDIEDTKKELKRIMGNVSTVIQVGIIPDYTCSTCNFMWLVKDNKIVELRSVI